MPPTQLPLPTPKKAQKCKYLTAGLRKIIRVKNKKLQNDISFLFYTHDTREKSTTFAKFGKKQKSPKIFFKAPQASLNSSKIPPFDAS